MPRGAVDSASDPGVDDLNVLSGGDGFKDQLFQALPVDIDPRRGTRVELIRAADLALIGRLLRVAEVVISALVYVGGRLLDEAQVEELVLEYRCLRELQRSWDKAKNLIISPPPIDGRVASSYWAIKRKPCRFFKGVGEGSSLPVGQVAIYRYGPTG